MAAVVIKEKNVLFIKFLFGNRTGISWNGLTAHQLLILCVKRKQIY
jgi:hypothetical protein